MYAVIETGGKQYKVAEGDVISVEKLGLDDGADVIFENVIAVSNDANFTVGTPYVKGATVTVTVKANGKGDKVIVFKYKPKKGYKKKQGHRQPFTQVEIKKINA